MELAVKIQNNKNLLASLKTKRENLDFQIENLELKIRNQERALAQNPNPAKPQEEKPTEALEVAANVEN